MRTVQVLESGISLEYLKKLNVPVVNILPLASVSPFTALSVILELGPINISPLPAGTMLTSVSRGCWRDTAGGTGLFFLVLGCFYY